MTLDKMTEDFLKFILEVKKPKDFVAVEEQELPENLKNQIFGLADELEDEKLIKNLQKFGSPGNRGIHFFILPRGLSYFEDERNQLESSIIETTNINGQLFNVSGDVISGDSISAKISKEEKSWFEKFVFPLVLIIIAAVLGYYFDKLVQKSAQSSQPPTVATFTSTIIPTSSSAETASSRICSFSDGPVTVGVIDLGVDYVYADIFDRLKELGLQPTWISPNSTYNDFIKYDVVYLPSGWSIKDSSLELHPKYLQDYVKINGGGLIVEQPNSERELSPAFLPYKISFITNKMDLEDWPVIIYDPSTSLTSGLELSDLPGPMDCAEMDSSYATIVKGSKTGCTSLAITSYGKGRILINMGNSSPSMESNGLPTISDIALCRMFGWVTKEYDR